MTLRLSFGLGSGGFSGLSEKGWYRPLCWAGSIFLFLTMTISGAFAQEVMTLEALRAEERIREADYNSAFLRLESLSNEFDMALERFASAQAAGNTADRDHWYVETRRIAGEKRGAQDRVDETAEELRGARERLRRATAEELDYQLAVGDTATDPVRQRRILADLADLESRLVELRNKDDPPVTLEPLPEIDAELRDGPTELRQKASILEFTATRYEGQRAFNELQLETLRADQTRLRRTRDFIADRGRFGETVPGGQTRARTEPQPGQAQPLTLEERIQALETLQEEINQRILTIRLRATELRRLAGGEWAWQ